MRDHICGNYIIYCLDTGTKHHINFFRQWFSYFWHATLLKMKNVHALNPFVFVLNSSMAMLSVTGWFDLRQKMTAYQKKYK